MRQNGGLEPFRHLPGTGGKQRRLQKRVFGKARRLDRILHREFRIGEEHGKLRACKAAPVAQPAKQLLRSAEHTSELQSLMRISYAVFCWKKKQNYNSQDPKRHTI